MSGLRILVRSARSVLLGRPRARRGASESFLPTRVWLVPSGREVSPALALIIERQERLRPQQPRG